MAVELIFKEKIIAPPVPRMASSRHGSGVNLKKKLIASLIRRR